MQCSGGIFLLVGGNLTRSNSDHSENCYLVGGGGNTFCRSKKTQSSSSFNRSNPIASDGSVMRCYNCELIKHFASACPHRKVEESNLTVHVTLLTGETNSHQKEMVAETLGKGILDSACTKTVAGTSWLDQFVECLDAK